MILTLSQLEQKAKDMVSIVANGGASQYVNFYFNEEDEVLKTLRVSNHNANPSRCNENTYVLVVDVPELESDVECGGINFSVNKKTFSTSSVNSWSVDTDGEDEQGYGIDYILDYWFN